ncbi:MAG: hypothetical protein JSS67_05270 [Bacteroidetes bacterium]|nr:hypothetical protein [Bacteroidota bacterium]
MILLLLFSFIQLAKTFHTHPNYSYSSISLAQHTSSIHGNYACALCDFQLAKDGFVTYAPSISTPVFDFDSFYGEFIIPNVETLAIASSDRAPPLSVHTI